MQKKAGIIGLLLFMVFLLSAYGEQEREAGQKAVFYVNKDETALVPEPFEIKGEDTLKLVEELLVQLQNVPEDADYKAAIPSGIVVGQPTMDENQLYLDFSENYHEMSSIREVLCRAAVVRTLTQVQGVKNITFTVNGNPLLDANANPVGIMSADSFVDNPGAEINAYKRATLTLYYANKNGDKLVTTKPTKTYSGNISMEKLIVEQLIQGPKEGSKAYATIPPETKILGISTKDGTCYVNLDEKFLDNPYEISDMLPVYSIVNSLTELSNISKVQFSINGKTDVKFRESISLESPFERNLDLIESQDTLIKDSQMDSSKGVTNKK